MRTLIDSVPPPPMTPSSPSSRTLIDAVSPTGRTILGAAPPPVSAAAIPLPPAPARDDARLHAPEPSPAAAAPSPSRAEPLRTREPSRPLAPASLAVPAISPPVRPQPESRMSLLIVALVCVLVAAVALVWFLWIKQPASVETHAPLEVSTKPVMPPVAPPVTPPPQPPVTATAETLIDAANPAAVVEVTGSDQHGASPFVAKLEKGKSYGVKVTAAGFMPSDLTVIGGSENKVVVKLDPKPRQLQVNSTPAQATVYIDGNPVPKKLTPATIDLTKGQAERKLRVMVRRVGFQPFFVSVKPEDFAEEADHMVFSVSAVLAAGRALPPPTTGAPKNPGAADPGSTPPADPKPEDPKPPVTPKPADPSGSASTGEPAPDWTK
jgi:hypothetical protein